MDGRAVVARQAQAASGISKAGQTKGLADGQADGPRLVVIITGMLYNGMEMV